jgi:Domain of unknown function (DUF4352)
MRPHTITTALAAAALAATLTACGNTGDTVKTTRATTSTTKTSRHTPASPKAAAKPTKAPTAGIGDTLTLRAYNEGIKLDATIVHWADPAHSSDEFTTPDKGKRWVAAQYKLRNLGSKTYSDSPSNGAQVIDSQGQRFDTTYGEITAGPAMSDDLKLPPGDTALGWVVFEVPTTSKIVKVQWAADSGFSDQTGQWQVSD